jgi:hypothetical protein
MMPSEQRELETLLIDYADALRDGTIPIFLKSLSREEAQAIDRSPEFSEALETARLLNEVHFADHAVHPDVGLFISRVDAEIGTRIKQAQAAPCHRVRRARTAPQ